MSADDRRERAAIYLSLHRGENYPALDVQLEETLRETERTGRVLHAVYCDVAGALNTTRRRQIVRLFELFHTRELPASIGFEAREPADRDFLGQQARAHGFSIAVGPRHVTIQTPCQKPATRDPPS
jgi:hypothetical protein